NRRFIMTHEYEIDFLNEELDEADRNNVIRFARAYMRVRELHNDKSIALTTREYYAELEAKLAEQLGEK
ncbi:hypothetical protein LCGC14_2912910, partial [marine sediment metagenome]